MRELPITNEELNLLREELNNSQKHRLKEIRTGLLILSATAVCAVVCWLLSEHFVIAGKLLAISLPVMAFGAYKTYWWYNLASIKKLDLDIRKGVKLQDEAMIKSHRKQSHRVKLSNGFKLHDYEIKQEHWKIGDKLIYEYTPNDLYILSTQIDDPG